MADFDKTIPINGTPADADPIRSNFFQLAIHHRGVIAPGSPELGYIWLDTTNAANWILKCYTQSGANPAAWVDLFDHMESTPTPSSGGGGGGLTRRLLTGVAVDSTAPSVDITGQTKCRFIISVSGLVLPYTGKFGMEFSAASVYIPFYPRDTFAIPVYTPGVITGVICQSSVSVDCAVLTAPAPAGQKIVTLGWGSIAAGYAYLNDGVNPPELVHIDSVAPTGPFGEFVATLHDDIIKAGGYAPGDELTGGNQTAQAVVPSAYRDLDSDDEFHIGNAWFSTMLPWKADLQIEYEGE